MRLIDADALRERMYHDAFEMDSDMQKWDGGCWIRYKMFENAIDDAPTVEPQQWIPDGCYNCTHNPRNGGDGECSCICPKIDAQQWIPVSSGELPEANEKDENGFIKAYLVQDARWMDVARWDGKFWIAWGYGTVLRNVVAWMPLPEPFREGGEA